MPYLRYFFRSPSPERSRQPTLGGLLSVFPPRPSPRPAPIEQRRQEPAGSRHIVGGVNEIRAVEMFRSFQHQFSLDNPLILGDDDNEVFRRCSYTREHKLAAINYALNTWERLPEGRLVHISRYYTAKRLRVTPPILTRWVKNKYRILYLKRGA